MPLSWGGMIWHAFSQYLYHITSALPFEMLIQHKLTLCIHCLAWDSTTRMNIYSTFSYTDTYMGSCNHDTSCCILLLDSIWLHPMLDKRHSLVIGYTYHHGSMNIVVIIPNTETKGNESCSCQSSKVLRVMAMIMTNNNTT